jgi:hypothetical protein
MGSAAAGAGMKITETYADPNHARPAAVNDLELSREDVSVGLSVMQTVYAVAMVLGFKNALEKSYALFLSPLEGPPGRLKHWVLLVALAAIMLLGLRFFFVTRNLYAFMIHSTSPLKRRVRWMTLVHFPITLLHALLFYSVCQAYADLVSSKGTEASAVDLTGRFVFLFAALLLLNGLWLLLTFGSSGSKAEGKWGWSNVLFAGLALLDALLVLEVFHEPAAVLAVSACGLFLINGIIDLVVAADAYILFPGGASKVTCLYVPPGPVEVVVPEEPAG